MNRILKNDNLNKDLHRFGYVKLNEVMSKSVMDEFLKQSKVLIREHSSRFPKGELFNFINASLDLKRASNELVKNYLNEELIKHLDLNYVDLYPVSHIIKPFGTKGQIWHQDSAVVNETKDFSLNAWMPFKKSSMINGCLWIIPGTHQLTNYKRQFGFNPIEGSFLKNLRKYMKPVIVEKGDVLLFYRNVIHGSSINWTPFRRIAAESLIVSKNAQFVNFHREDALQKNKIIEFKVSVEHFLKENPKEDFYSKSTPYTLHEDEAKEQIIQKINKELKDIINETSFKLP